MKNKNVVADSISASEIRNIVIRREIKYENKRW